MQFKHPEILYALALLVLPILVHLFQLQKFKKTPFTNVAFLKKIVQKSRKSSALKKWLLLCSRLLLFTGIIIAFSQPYFSHKKTADSEHIFIYLDNSFSTSAEGKKGPLLQDAINTIIENRNPKFNYSLLTNTNFHSNLNSESLKKQLINLKKTSKSLTIQQILLRIKSINSTKTNTSYKIVLISDFQNINKNNSNEFTNVTSPISLIHLNAEQKNNVSIDSVFVNHQNNNDFEVHVQIKNQGIATSNIPIALYNKNNIVAKKVFSIEKNSLKNIVFPIQNLQSFEGKITIENNDIFDFDNQFYFAVNPTHKINVLSIGKTANFFPKIYTENEFNFKTTSITNINYNSLQKQELILLNEIEQIPNNLSNSLVDFLKDGGSLVIIPSKETQINSYNSFFNMINVEKISLERNDSMRISKINYTHPFFNNVFSKEITNFQYPYVKSWHQRDTRESSSLLSFDNLNDFISFQQLKNGLLYWITAPLQLENSNFINSPLVVPVFYNFGKLSLKNPKPFYSLGKYNQIDIATTLGQNDILTINNTTQSFIPQQQTYQQRVSLFTNNQPTTPGIFNVDNKTTRLSTIAFNINKEESLLNFYELENITKLNKNLTLTRSSTQVFQDIQKKNEVTWLWKWFLALAIVSLCFEIYILKYLKP